MRVACGIFAGEQVLFFSDTVPFGPIVKDVDLIATFDNEVNVFTLKKMEKNMSRISNSAFYILFLLFSV